MDKLNIEAFKKAAKVLAYEDVTIGEFVVRVRELTGEERGQFNTFLMRNVNLDEAKDAAAAGTTGSIIRNKFNLTETNAALVVLTVCDKDTGVSLFKDVPLEKAVKEVSQWKNGWVEKLATTAERLSGLGVQAKKEIAKNS